MPVESCVFCRIIAGDINADIVEQNDTVVVIKDIAPKAPVHYLIIPRLHVASVRDIDDSDKETAAALLQMAKLLSHKLSGSQSFRLVMNCGEDAGQSVFHLHAHFLSGKRMLDL